MLFGNHITGIYEKAFDASISWDERFALAKELGFDYIELSIDEQDFRLDRLNWTREEAFEFRTTANKYGMDFYTMCLSAHRRFPFGSADPAIRERAHEIMEKAIDLSALLGIKVIQLAGYDVYYEDSTPESRKLFMEGMEWSAKMAARKQIMLAMEIMDTPFLNSISKFRMYEGMIQSPWFKVYPDVGNISAWPENDPGWELRHGADCIVGVHLKDTLRVTEDFGGLFKGVDFGTGHVDFEARFRDLNSIGYAGPFMIEMWHKNGEDDREAISKAVAFLQDKYAKAND